MVNKVVYNAKSWLRAWWLWLFTSGIRPTCGGGASLPGGLISKGVLYQSAHWLAASQVNWPVDPWADRHRRTAYQLPFPARWHLSCLIANYVTYGWLPRLLTVWRYGHVQLTYQTTRIDWFRALDIAKQRLDRVFKKFLRQIWALFKHCPFRACRKGEVQGKNYWASDSKVWSKSLSWLGKFGKRSYLAQASWVTPDGV